MRMLTTSLILTALLGLTACEPSGPSADIGDNIDQVADNAAADSAALERSKVDNSTTDAATDTPSSDRPEVNDQQTTSDPEVITEQKAQIEQANQAAAEEAKDRLNEILEDTIDEP